MTTSTRPRPSTTPPTERPGPRTDGLQAPGPDPSSGLPPTPRPRPSRLALWSADHRWAVLLSSLLTVAAGIWLLTSLGIATSEIEDSLSGDSRRAYELAQADFGQAPTEMVIVTDPDGPLAPQTATTLATDLVDRYQGLPGVAAVGQPFPGQDGSLVLPVEMTADAERAAVDVTAVSAATEALAADHHDLTVGQVGDGSFSAQVDQVLGEDFRRAELYAVPVTLGILLVAFGAVVAAGVPLVLGLGSVAAAMGATALVSQNLLPVDPNSQSLILLIGLAVGVDYALFVLRRAREERAAGASVRDSIGIAGATAGRAVVVSGLTVVVAMSGMLVAGGMFASMGIGAMVVVGIAVVAAVTTLPALLSVLGDKVDALRLPFTRRRAARRDAGRSTWGRLAGAVTTRPLAWGAAATAVLVALALPALGMRTSLGGVETLPPDLPAVAAYTQLERAVPSDGDAVTFLVSAPADAADEVSEALLASAPELLALEHVTGTAPEVETSVDGTVTRWQVGLGVDQSDSRLEGAVDAVRTEVLPDVRAALADVPGAEVHLSGAAMTVDLTTWMDSRLPWVVAFVLVLTLAVMSVSFGSPWLAAATVGLNALSVGAAYGVLQLVFGGSTWAEGLLDFTTSGTIAAWLPLMLFVVLFGLSMDYHVFVVSRVRELRDAGAGAREAIRQGVARSAGVVTAAATVMVGVFAVFGTLSMLEMKQMGVGLAVAILLDATLVRGVLLPAVLALLGDRAHTGPRWLPRLAH